MLRLPRAGRYFLLANEYKDIKDTTTTMRTDSDRHHDAHNTNNVRHPQHTQTNNPYQHHHRCKAVPWPQPQSRDKGRGEQDDKRFRVQVYV